MQELTLLHSPHFFLFYRLHGGPFTALELGQLSLHCTSSNVPSSNTSRNSVGSTANNNNLGAWSTLDGDLLSTLTPMLQSHVTSALGIDLVDEGRKVIAKSMEEKGNDNKKPVITIHQVSG